MFQNKQARLAQYFFKLSFFSAFLSIISFSISAKQLVNTLPAELSMGWQQCLLYQSSPAVCQSAKLPLDRKQISPLVTQQTFIKQFIMSSALKQNTLGIWIENIDEVDEVYFNDFLIGRTGKFSPDFETGFRANRLYLIPSEKILFNQTNRLKIKTFSSRHQNGIQISSPTVVKYLNKQHHLQEQDYLFVVSATILMLLAIFQIFYFVAVKEKRESIYCALFLIAFAIIALARSQMPLDSGLNLSSAFKLESFMMNIGIISASLFLYRFFEIELRTSYKLGVLFLGISALIIIIWPFAIDLRFIAELNYILVLFISFFVIGSVLILSIHKQRDYTKIMGATYIGGWLILFYDALMQLSGSFELSLSIHKEILPIGAAIVGIVFCLAITHKYWQYFKGSTYDHLTGTLLRPAFFQRLSEEMQRCQRGDEKLIVAVIDIQQAKEISANFGYSTGNALLLTVSNSLSNVLRPFDLICRISDEQFCIAAAIHNEKDADICLKRVYEELMNIEQTLEQGMELYLDTRIGGIIYDQEQHLSVSQLLQDANYALSKAKSQDKHNYLLVQNSFLKG